LFAGLVFIERARFKTVPKPATELSEGGGGGEKEKQEKTHLNTVKYSISFGLI